jgi:16S rRNA (guanine(966)-N(2))-methyltransferase RsmD
MRVVSGEAKGRRLKTPRGDRIRPTADRVKESLFEIIGQRIRDARVLDLFAGTGNLGIEALSRGARSVLFVDADRTAILLVGQNLTLTRLGDRAETWKSDAHSALGKLAGSGRRFEVVLLDPPYGSGYEEPVLRRLSRSEILSPGGLTVIEHDRRIDLPERIDSLERLDQRRFGDTVLSFYRQSPGKARP